MESRARTDQGWERLDDSVYVAGNITRDFP
jgi:hypothetical protein